MDEQNLVKQAQQGSKEAFSELVVRYEREVYTIAFRLLGKPEDAADAAQEALMKAFRSLPRFRGEASFKTWISRITINVCRDELRRRYRRGWSSSVSLDQQVRDDIGPLAREVADVAACPEEVYLQAEGEARIQLLIASLKPEFRLVVVLRDLQGWSYEEIARYLGVSLGTVKSRLSRARSYLRDALYPEREPETDWQRLNQVKGGEAR